MVEKIGICAWCQHLVGQDRQPGRKLSKSGMLKLRLFCLLRKEYCVTDTCCAHCGKTVVLPEIEAYRASAS